MNIKQFGILVIIASLVGIYFGADYLRLRSHFVDTLQIEEFTKQNIGQFLDFTLRKSQDAPQCVGDCQDVKRYHFVMKGDIATVQMTADYNRKTDKFSNRIYCNEQGEIIEINKGVQIFVCR